MTLYQFWAEVLGKALQAHLGTVTAHRDDFHQETILPSTAYLLFSSALGACTFLVQAESFYEYDVKLFRALISRGAIDRADVYLLFTTSNSFSSAMPVVLEICPKWRGFRGESGVFSHVIIYPRLYASRPANSNTESITGYSIFVFGFNASHLSSVTQHLYRSSTMVVRTLIEPFKPWALISHGRIKQARR
jgi:hypothetical protein